MAKKKEGIKMKENREEKVRKIKLKVVGIGGGGGNIVSEIASRIKSRNVSFLVANTDLQALQLLPQNVSGFAFGQKITRGQGTGMDEGLGEQAALSEKERIKKLFGETDFLIVVSCLGGGVGSGATPVFAKILKSSGVLSLGVFTLPFNFEGEKKKELALKSLQKMKNYFQGIVVFPNERIFQLIEKTTPFKEALSTINKKLVENLQALIETIYFPGLINIDFADLQAILQGFGKFVYINTLQTSRQSQLVNAFEKLLNSPLYPYEVKGAKDILFNIESDKTLSVSEMNQISQMIFERVSPQAKIIFGICNSQKFQKRIKVFLLASGCKAEIFSETKKEFNDKKEPKKEKGEKKKKKIEVKSKERGEKKEPQKEGRVQKEVKVQKENKGEGVRKNGLELQKEIEETEKEILEKEKFWEIPPFLRKDPETH